MITKFFNKTIAVFLTAIFIFGLFPAAVFAQPNPPSSLGEVKGFNRSVFDSHFSRADREISPERWLAEAKFGVSQALYAWELTASRLYEDGQVFEEEKNKVERWSGEELEKRFSQWLIGRFFGEVKEKALMGLSSLLGEIQKNYSWHLDEEGNIVFDDKTGDPLIVRPDEEGREFSRDLLLWRSEADKIVITSGVSLENVLLNLYPELLDYVPGEMYETVFAIINETGTSLSASIKREFENMAAREERIFTSRRTRDIFSLRRKSDDESAKLFTEKLVAETGEACRQGIEELAARIEEAEAGTGDLALMGEEWLRLYREQFEKGLKAWEEAEERFFIRRIEWEQESFRLFSEGEEIWYASFSQFEEERQKWELKARELFQSGETLFKNISEDFQRTIAEAKKEFEINMEMRIGTGTTRVKALVDMYLVCSSAAVSSKDSIIFWMKYYGISSEKEPVDPDFAEWLWNERRKLWEEVRNKYLIAPEFYHQIIDPQLILYIQDIIDGKKTFAEETAFANENKNILINLFNFIFIIAKGFDYDKFEKFAEIQKNYDAYTSYLDKALDARERILADYAELIGTGALKDILSPGATTEDFYLDEYQIALVRAKALVLYWERKTAIAEAVMDYAGELSAGRMTEAEGIRAWEKAKAAYNESLAVYESELKKLNEQGADIQNQQEILNRLTGEMQLIEENLIKLNSDYSIFVNISVVNRANYYLKTLNEKYDFLVKDYKLFLRTGTGAVYRTAIEYGLSWGLSKQREDAEAALDKLINGDEETISLAELKDKVSQGLIAETELKIRLAGIALFLDADNGTLRSFYSDYSGADWYAAVRGRNLSDKEKAAFYGDKLIAQLTADYKNASRLLLEKRLEFELDALKNFLKEDRSAGVFEYPAPEFCLLDAETAAEIWEILSKLKNRMEQGLNVYTDNDKENELISYFIYGGSFFEGSQKYLAEYFNEYLFCAGLLELYGEYAHISSFGQKEAWSVTCNSLTSLFADYGIKLSGNFLPGAESLFAKIREKDGDLVQNAAQFLNDFDNCFSIMPQWLEIEIENWKNSFMKFAAADIFYSGIRPEKTYSDIYFEQEKLFSAKENLYLYAYSVNYMEDNEAEKLNASFMEIRNNFLLLDYMGQITMFLDILHYEETAAENEKHWRHHLEGKNIENIDPVITIVSAWRDGVLADARFNAAYYTNRINDTFKLFSQGDYAKEESVSTLNRNLYLEEASRISRSFSLLEYQYNDIVYLGRAYEFTQLETKEINERKNQLFDAIAVKEAEYNAIRDKFFIAADEFMKSGLLYDEQYNVLKAAQNNSDQYRFEYEKQDAIRRWASTAYLDRETIDPEHCQSKLTKAQTVFSVLSDIYGDEKKRAYDDPQYNALYSEYEQSFRKMLKVLETCDSLSLAVYEEQNRKETIFASYKNSLNNLGYVDTNYANYARPAEMKNWTVKDFITVKDGRLAFIKDDSMRLYGVDVSTANRLNEFFKSDESHLSDFEESLLALSRRMSEYFSDNMKLIKWSLARDFLMCLLKNANGNITYLADQYIGPGMMAEYGDLGQLQVKSSINLLDRERELYEALTRLFMPNRFSTFFFTPSPRLEDSISIQYMAWCQLSDEERADLEYYTILTLSGSPYSEGFSQIYTLSVYELAYNYVNNIYTDAKEEREKPINFLSFLRYDKLIDINGSALNNIKPVYERTRDKVFSWIIGITNNLSSIKNYSASYKASCEKLETLEAKKENGQSIDWNDISKALDYILKKEDIEEIRISWEKMQKTSAEKYTSLSDALGGLLSWAKSAENISKTNLETFWLYSAQDRLNNEKDYQTAVEAYMAGTGNVDDLRASAESAFGKNAAAWKNHLANMHTALTNDLSLYLERNRDFYGEFSVIGNELVVLTEKALANRYSAELAAREIEWDFMLRDIQDKYSEWLDSAALIFENGRADWNTGFQKMQEAYRQWTVNFQDEYNRVNEEWTMAYLSGLEDKERWLEQAAAAANQASEESYLSLLGAEAERLSRFVDTREPLGIRDAVPQAQNLMTELLQSSGIANMANAFGSMSSISSTVSTVVRRGMGGVSAWDAALVKSAAADLAKKTNAEIAAEEARKLAYTASANASEIINSLSTHVQSANQSFRESMDDIFIMKGSWRKSGNSYVKDVVKGSTLFNPVISDTVTITGYADYIMKPVSIQTNLDVNYLSTLDSYTIQELIRNVYNEVNAYRDEIFGGKDDKPVNIGRQGNAEEKRTRSPGKFGAYIGYDPDTKDKFDDLKRESLFYDEGAGELGRLLADFTYWRVIDKSGKAEQALPNWDKRMWDDSDSSFKAPTIRTVGQIAGAVVAAAVAIIAAPYTGGASLGIAVGVAALVAGISTTNDLIFNTLDAAFGYKTWEEAGFEIGKASLINLSSSMISGAFSGFGSAASQGLTAAAMKTTSDAAGKILIQTAMTGAQTAITSLTTSAINGITYNSIEGWGYNTDIFNNGAKNILGSTVSSMTSTFTTGTMKFINSGLDMEKLKGFNKLNKEDLGKLNSLTGSLAGQAVNYAFGNDITLNLFNLSMFKNENLSGGILELHLGRDGAAMNFGTGGANLSIDNLIAAARGAQVWNVNNQIGRYVNSNDFDSAIALRAQYGYGDDRQKNQLWDILKRTAEIRIGDGDYFAETTIDNGKRVINLSGYQSNMSEEDQMLLAVILGHEAYRDGIVTDDNYIETRSATQAHTEMAIKMLLGGENVSINENLMKDIRAYLAANGDINAFNAYVDSNYDSSGDYWKLTREGNLEYDGFATLRDADGNILRSYKEMGLSRIDDIEGSLLWLLNIDRNDSAGVDKVREIMTWFGIDDTNDIHANMGKTISKGTISALYSFSNVFENKNKEIINRIYGSPGEFLNLNHDDDDIFSIISTLSRYFTTDEIMLSQSTYGSNYVTYPDKDSLGFFNTLITPTLFNKYLPRTITNSEGKQVTYTYCNQFVYDVILNRFGNEIYNNMFPGQRTNANSIFLSFINNPYMERLDINEWGTEGIKQLADDGYLIIASSYNNSGSGHIAFLGNRNLITSSIPRTSLHMNKSGFDLPAHHYLFVQAGTFNGIISNQFATNDWETTYLDQLRDSLYFYRVRVNP
ncbi:MAG: hypothetical protein LBQ93_01695 [Treponema sp.]|jgi:hypothetical protein|nr:hypothetical protein [Treponema sp.]